MDADSRWLVEALLYAGMALFGMALIAFSAAAEMAFASVSRAQLRRVLAAQKARAQAAAILDRRAGAPALYAATLEADRFCVGDCRDDPVGASGGARPLDRLVAAGRACSRCCWLNFCRARG